MKRSVNFYSQLLLNFHLISCNTNFASPQNYFIIPQTKFIILVVLNVAIIRINYNIMFLFSVSKNIEPKCFIRLLNYLNELKNKMLGRSTALYEHYKQF
jgi:hypothetical protein